MCVNIGSCISDSNNVTTGADTDNEAEEAKSTILPIENLNGKTMAYTFKHPCLLWTPKIHKRFVDVVSHLGVNVAVPKIIMQLMNVEGFKRNSEFLTKVPIIFRENVRVV